MRASDELAILQRKFPPWTEDRCAPLLIQLQDVLSPDLLLMVQSRSLVVGEVGIHAPNAYTRHFDDSSHLVVSNSGLLDFVFAVAQTLHGAARIFEGNRVETAPAQKIEGVAVRLAKLYAAWKSGALWNGDRLQPLRCELPKKAAERADQLAWTAMMFILTHELGHVLRYEPEMDGADETARTPSTHEEELGADFAAIRLIFRHSQHWQRGQSIRIDLAGAVVALRVLSGLEKLGHRPPGNHPHPEERLIRLWSAMRELSGSEDSYWYKTTIAYAFDEHMEAAENLFLGRGRMTELTAERIFSRLCAVLEECVQGRESQERALRVINFDLDRAPAGILRDVFKAARRVLRPLRPPYIAIGGVEVRHKVATLFMELLPKFHRQARVIFKEAPTKEEKDGDDRLPQR